MILIRGNVVYTPFSHVLFFFNAYQESAHKFVGKTRTTSLRLLKPKLRLLESSPLTNDGLFPLSYANYAFLFIRKMGNGSFVQVL